MTSGHTTSLFYQKNNFILKTHLPLQAVSRLSQTRGFEIISNHYTTLNCKGLATKEQKGRVMVFRSSKQHGLSLSRLLTSQREVCVSTTSELGSLEAQTVKNLPAMQDTQVWSLDREDLLEKGMATTPVLLSGESHGQRSLEGYSPSCLKESDMTEVNYHSRIEVARSERKSVSHLVVSDFLKPYGL